MSPAIDCSVLRQVANGYLLAVGLARRWAALPAAALAVDVRLAGRLRRAVGLMPHGAAPVVGARSGRILEYPAPFPQAVTDAPPPGRTTTSTGTSTSSTTTSTSSTRNNDRPSAAAASAAPRFAVSETIDPGHRHFSHMHWLYPGTFLPSDPRYSDPAALYRAAAATLAHKVPPPLPLPPTHPRAQGAWTCAVRSHPAAPTPHIQAYQPRTNPVLPPSL